MTSSRVSRAEASASDRILVKSSGEIFFLKAEEIDWIEAEGDYMKFHVAGRAHLMRETMARLEARLDGKRFIRIHRSTIVNVDRVRKLSPSFAGEYAVVLADGDSVGMNEFPQVTADPAAQPIDHQPEQLIEASPDMAPDMPADVPLSISDRMARLKPGLTMVAPSLPLTDSHNDVRPLEDIERDAIRFAIAHYRGQMSEVARKLKIGRSTLYRKLEGLGLEEEAAEVAVNETMAAE